MLIVFLFQEFSEEIIRPLFSREWSLRETGFHHLRPAMRAKMQSQEGGVVYRQIDEALIKSCCEILALGCSDPVYKVYVASLVSSGG